MTEDTSVTRDPQIRRGVIASVIASVIVIIFIQPVLRLTWSAVLAFGARFLQGYIDSIYTSAALGHRNYVDVLLLMSIYSLFSGMSLGMILIFTRLILQPKRRPRKLRKHHLALLLLSVILFHILAVFVIVPPFANLQLNTSFQQRLAVLAPRLTELEEEELEAAWASMQTRADYEVIRLRMEQSAKDHGITLPKVLWK